MMENLYKKSLVLLVPLAAGSAFIEPKKLPVGILVGGVLALLNLKGLSRGIAGLLGTYKPTLKLMLLSIFRILLLSIVIIILAATRAVNLLGLAAGFSVVTVLIVMEGLSIARRADQAGGEGIKPN
jgi:hypothetical protein